MIRLRLSGRNYSTLKKRVKILFKTFHYNSVAGAVITNIAGRLKVDEPAADLGLVSAIASSFRNVPVDPHTAVFGEVGLTGEVRGALQAQARAREAHGR